MNTAISIQILAGQVALGQEFQLIDLDITLELNRIPYAELRFLEGDPAQSNYQVANAARLQPGQTVKITLSYERPDARIAGTFTFEGIVTGQRLEVDEGQAITAVELKDKAFVMASGRRSRFFEKGRDSDYLAEVLKAHRGLGKGKWVTTAVQHEKMLQFDSTDWDFLLMRAEANGLLVNVRNATVNLLEVGATQGKTHALDFLKDDIYNFEMAADGSDQINQQSAAAWDYKKQKRIESPPPKPPRTTQGNLQGKATAQKMGVLPGELLNGVSVPAPELKTWSNAALARSQQALLRGRIALPGNPVYRLGDRMKLSGVGRRFNGATIISGIRHRISSEGWQTDVQLGLDEQWHYEKYPTQNPLAAGLLPGVHALQIGVVAPFQADPQKAYRVKVKLPAVTKDKKAFVWARLATLEGGSGRGHFFYPEPGDEVLVGFLNGDPRQPIILGALFGGSHKLPDGLQKLDQKNGFKGIVTKGGHALVFNDTDQVLTIKTGEPVKQGQDGSKSNKKSKGHTIQLDQKNGKIEIRDKFDNQIILTEKGLQVEIKSKKGVVDVHDSHDNRISMNDKGIAVKSAKAAVQLEDKDKNQLVLDKSGVSMKSDKTIKLKVGGNEIQITTSGIVVKSGAKLELKASGKVDISGAAIDLK